MASITVNNLNRGTISQEDGSYRITDLPFGTYKLSFGLIGYEVAEQEVTVSGAERVNVVLQPLAQSLKGVVVVGYGRQRKQDLTGAVATITAKDFNKGIVTTPEQLIAGKIAGVQITSNGGAPGAGSRIRIRGGASLNANNDPLVVIDGVPVDFAGITGAPNPLSLINPNDIESFTILKDASSTAIYGSRAANGVIIITTKKGTSGGKLQASFHAAQSFSHRINQVDVLSADQFRAIVNEHGDEAQKALLGRATTDWQDQIFQQGLGTDNNISINGGIKSLPYRVSFGYFQQQGILKTSHLNRKSLTLNLSPRFLNDKLKIDINLKGAVTHNRFADLGAIGSAVAFDPTKQVYEANKFGGYYEWIDFAGQPNLQAPRNPLSLLEQRRNKSEVSRSIGNVQMDYQFHFLPQLRVNLNLGYDISKSNGNDRIAPTAAVQFSQGGSERSYAQKKTNKVLDLYFNYAKSISRINSYLDATIGYSYQDFLRDEPASTTVYGIGTPVTTAAFKTQNSLLGVFGRLNYTFNEKYLLTVNVRRDGSSRFKKGNKWGTFPSAALGWKINEEEFMRNAKAISELKLRIGYGIVGQQDIIGNDYPYLSRYNISEPTAQYQFGSSFIPTLRAEGYDENIKWEETTTYNTGIDFGFLNNKFSGSIDYYKKRTKNLLSVIPVPAGSNLTNRILTNVGNIDNEGLELAISINKVPLKEVSWDFGFNITYNKNRITNLSKVKDPSSPGVLVGSIAGGIGNTIQIHSVGFRPNSFYVFRQVYDKNGNPLEGVYEDRNNDGIVNDKDLHQYKNPEPKVYLGFNSQFSYKQWNLGWLLRAQLGNYVYNNFSSNYGSYKSFSNPNFLNNISSDILLTNFKEYQLKSDYYINNASFLKLDNVSIGYNFKKIVSDKILLSATATVQNVLTITPYEGLDPEISTGIDNNFYPRPRTYTLGVNLKF
jgi:iron complex outermembrane receptor protein